jgi:FtsH-binding integral membrane protein
MEICAVIIGVVVGALAGLRVLRSPLMFALIGVSVLGIFGYMAAMAPDGSPTDFGRILAAMYAYGLGFLFFMVVPAIATFAVTSLVRRACCRRPPKLPGTL